MNLSGIAPSTPLSLRNIDLMQGLSVRNNLRHTLTTFFTLFNETRNIPVDETIVEKVRNFADYITDSLDDVKKLERRSTWLVRYGTIINECLISVKYTNTKYFSDFDNPMHDELADHLVEMVDAIKRFTSESPQLLAYYEASMIELLDRIIVEAFEARPPKDSNYYAAAVRRIKSITQFVNLSIGVKIDTPVGGIITALTELSYFIRHSQNQPGPSSLN